MSEDLKIPPMPESPAMRDRFGRHIPDAAGIAKMVRYLADLQNWGEQGWSEVQALRAELSLIQLDREGIRSMLEAMTETAAEQSRVHVEMHNEIQQGGRIYQEALDEINRQSMGWRNCEAERDALKSRVAERGDSIYITAGHGPLYGTPEVIGWITDELDRLEVTLAELEAHARHDKYTDADLAQRDREVLALREGIQKHKDRYIFTNPDHEDYELWKILESTAQAGEEAERRIRAEEAERIIRIITDPHNNIAWRLFRDGESIHADPRHIAAILGTEPNP